MNCSDFKRNISKTLTFKRAELLYDIVNYSFVEGDIMPVEDEHSRHQVLDIGQTGNIDRVTRMLNLAHSECVEMLYPYTKKEVTAENLDNMMATPEEYVIEMSVPQSFSDTTMVILENLIHEYLVCRVLEDWMSITKPDSQANWRDKLESIKTKIQTSLVSRNGTLRRKQSPF